MATIAAGGQVGLSGPDVAVLSGESALSEDPVPPGIPGSLDIPVHVSRYLARPGRRALVAADLDDLRGAAGGTVELPIWLFWQPNRTFDLDDAATRRWVYQIVLREAGRAEDLARYLDGDVLRAIWPDLRLPRGVRQAWEELHPSLAATVPA